MNEETKLTDPTANFCKAVIKDGRVRGLKVAKELFGDCGWDDDVMKVTSEVFGDIIAGTVIGAIGNSLYDIPMQDVNLGNL